jgi:hypothetical protein
MRQPSVRAKLESAITGYPLAFMDFESFTPAVGRIVQRMTAYGQLTRCGQTPWSDAKLKELVRASLNSLQRQGRAVQTERPLACTEQTMRLMTCIVYEFF